MSCEWHTCENPDDGRWVDEKALAAVSLTAATTHVAEDPKQEDDEEDDADDLQNKWEDSGKAIYNQPSCNVMLTCIV